MAETIVLSDQAYQRLVRLAERRGMTPEQVLDRLMTADLVLLLEHLEADVPPAPAADAARAAVQRLTGLFADLARPDLDALLDDPRLALANADRSDPRP
jgi:hypothetical protein